MWAHMLEMDGLERDRLEVRRDALETLRWRQRRMEEDIELRRRQKVEEDQRRHAQEQRAREAAQRAANAEAAEACLEKAMRSTCSDEERLRLLRRACSLR